MSDDLSYISKNNLPQFSNLKYQKERSDIPVLESDYDCSDIEAVLEDDSAVLLRDKDGFEAVKRIIDYEIGKLTSLSEVRTALDPRQTRGITEMYTAENEDALYLTEHQFRMRFM